MKITEIKELLEKNCGDDIILIQATEEFFNIENSNDKKFNDRYDKVIKKYYDKRWVLWE